MDFCQVLQKAKKNEQNGSGGVRYYSTKFEPPKKMKKENKNLSANIKRFLAKKEAEEQQKLQHENKKKEELLALRAQDKKATRRVNVMLKRTKSANQSVLEEAVDKTHTAVTRAGPEQPDEDDYGYVSQEATALYEKMMQKYSEIPEEPKFNLLKKKVSTNLSSTKERVQAALEKEKEEAMQPRKRKRRKQQEGAEDNAKESEEEQRDYDRDSAVAKAPSKPKPRPAAPPPLSFAELLQIAAQKQHEPIIIEEKPQEEEKLYTKKQKRELEKEREWREHRERRHKEMEREAINSKVGDLKILERQLTKPLVNTSKPPSTLSSKPGLLKRSEEKSSKPTNSKSSSSSNSSGSGLPNRSGPVKNIKSSSVSSTKEGKKVGESTAIKAKPKEFPPRDLMQKGKPKEFPPRDLKPKPFPPGDVRGAKGPKPKVSKGRILDDDSEYDSELDDFIDDGPEEGDYSSYIKEIFGYDKSRYRDVDEDVDNMESTFAQQMKEEVISAKIGIKEDLEDMKKEEEEKRRKALMKKKMNR